MSCIKIIGQDLGFDLDIRAFINQFPDLCYAGTDIEGAFNVTEENLRTISGVMGFNAGFVPVGGGLEAQYDGNVRILLDFHAFKGDQNHAHCMVYLKLLDDDDTLKVICPSKNDYDEISVKILRPWKCNLVEIRAAPLA